MSRAKWRWPRLANTEWFHIHARGELDIATAPNLLQVLTAAITGHPRRHVVVDLHDVTFIDCTGLGVLMQARNHIPDRFWLRDPSRQVARLLDLTNLTASFAVFDKNPGLRAASQERRTAQVRHCTPRYVTSCHVTVSVAAAPDG